MIKKIIEKSVYASWTDNFGCFVLMCLKWCVYINGFVSNFMVSFGWVLWLHG